MSPHMPVHISTSDSACPIARCHEREHSSVILKACNFTLQLPPMAELVCRRSTLDTPT